MRVLFICPNWAGLAQPIIDEMRSQSHEVVHLDHSDLSSFVYADQAHRVLSKVYQLFTKKSYKHYITDKEITRTLMSFFIAREPFDVVIMTEPNIFTREQLALIKQYTNKLVVTLWDSLTKSPSNGDCLELFDIVFSYDSEDCKKYKFIKTKNYIDPRWQSETDYQLCQYDVFSVMSFTKNRYKQVVEFLDANPQIKPNIYFYIDHERKRKYIQDKRIRVIKHLMLGEELKENIQSSKATLDLLQGHQAGLSFRVYESIGYRRKLITTNANIKEYDLYIASNMCVLDESYRIQSDFFSTTYTSQEATKLEKYSLHSWVKSVMSNV